MFRTKTKAQKEREGVRLRKAIQSAKYSQTAFARRIGVGEAMLSRWVNGTEPMPHHKDTIAAELRVAREDIWDD